MHATKHCEYLPCPHSLFFVGANFVMSSISRIQGSLASLTQETTLALANFNFDFSLMKVEPPAEYMQLGTNLTSRRRDAAESGTHHSTAGRLGSLFQSAIPETPSLIKAYGQRASEISSSPEINPRGTAEDGAFRDFVGLDGTTI